MVLAFLSPFLELFSNMFFLFGYVSNINSFPNPLSGEEEQYYIERFKAGDEDARNLLIERNLRLVAHIVKKYNMIGNDSDDLISIGTIGLIKAVTTFDNTKGIRLATYASRCIENEILMQIRSNKKSQKIISLHDPIGTDVDGNEISLLDVISTDEDSVIDQVELKMEIIKLYNKMKSSLKKRERLILELRYGILSGISKTQKEIAKLLGISRSYVSRIEKKAIKKLEKEMNML